MEPTPITDLLEDARRGLHRLTAAETWAAMRDGAVVIDTRSEENRLRQGLIPGARYYPLSVLEWRLCPSADHYDAGIGYDDHIVVVCAEGYSSSLAAARLQQLGFRNATDLIDGAEGWRQSGLPMDHASDQVRAR